MDNRKMIYLDDAIDAIKAMPDCPNGFSNTYDKAWIISILEEVPEKPTGWIPVSERLPENTEPVNITWVNRKPEPYYADIKDKPFAATGHYCNGRWWWYSAVCQDYLDEYGKCDMDEMDGDIEVVAWMPLPEPYGGEE